MSHCRSCGAEVVWAVTRKGRRMPVDAEPVRGGNVRLVEPGDGGPPLAEYVTSAFIGDVHVSHFATCPQAPDWRQPQ